VRDRVTGPVRDTFDGLAPGGPVTNWNIYCPIWCPVGVADFPSTTNKSLELTDKDPYDYCRAIRVFPESKSVTIQFKIHAAQNRGGALEIEVTDRFGSRPVRLVLADDERIKIVDGAKRLDLAPYQADRWYDMKIEIDVAKGKFDISLDGKPAASTAAFAEFVQSVERISFRTGPRREEPTLKTPTDTMPDRVTPNPDLPQPPAVYHIDDVAITPADSPGASTGR
jgi:hypothetical protein